MAEGIVQVTEGSGKKLHTWNRTIGANSIEDEFTLPGEFPYASYTVVFDVAGVANDHIIQIMAGASLPVRIRSIEVQQGGNLTAAAVLKFGIFRLTTAGTGGTAVTPRPMDSADAASGATAATLPTIKGTEGVELRKFAFVGRQAFLATASQYDGRYTWTQQPGMKPIIIPAGIGNGLALKSLVTLAGGGVMGTIDFVETNFV